MNSCKSLIVPFIAIAALVAAPAAYSRETDLSTTCTDSEDPVAVGATVTYTVTIANAGPDEPMAQITVEIHPPLGTPANLEDYLNQVPEAVAAFAAMRDSFRISENVNSDDFGVFFGVDDYCELKIQPQDPSIPPGSSGDFLFEAVLPEASRAAVVHVNGPGLDMEIERYGKGACATGISDEDCLDVPCLGPRVSAFPAVTAPISYGYTGDGLTTGDGPLVNFPPGNIAMIDRGNNVDFEFKAVMAVNAQAAAVIIADHDNFNDATVDPHDLSGGLACQDFCSAQIVTVPVIMISWADGEAIRAAMAQGEVTMTIGVVETDGVHQATGYVWEYGGARSDFNPVNDNFVETTTIRPAVDPPVASFVFDPPEPEVGEEIIFTDASAGEPTAWSWDFGDMEGTSTDQHPAYTYDAAGTYTVSLTVSNDGGSDTATAEVVVAEAGETIYFVPAAAKAAGAEGSFFLTDLVINNAGDEAASYMFGWLPRGLDNSAPTMSDSFTLNPGVSVMYTDILGEVFGASDGAVGALTVVSDSSDLLLVSRTYNSTDNGTFGQSMPVYADRDLIAAGERKRLVFFVEDETYRSNLGLMNGTASPIRVMWELYGPDATLVESGHTDLAPWSNKQLNQVFENEAPISGGYIDVWTTTENGAFTAYGSLLDNMTSDPTTVLPQAPVAADDPTADQYYYLPAAAKAAGSEGSFFLTDLVINNAGNEVASYAFAWLPRGEDNSAPTMSEEFTLNPGVSTVFTDVLGEVFGAEDGAIGALAVISDCDDLLLMSRTYNSTVGGTFGQSMPGCACSNLITAGERKRLISFIEDDAYRSNLGMLNAGTFSIRVMWERFGSDGTLIESGHTDLAPWGNKQLNQVFEDEAPVSGGYIDVWTTTENGAFTAYGSLLDNMTSDPTTVLPQ